MVFAPSKILERVRRAPVLRLLPEWRRPPIEALQAERERLADQYAAARRGVRCQSVKRIGDALCKVTLEVLKVEVRR